VADIIALALMPDADLPGLRERVATLAGRFPLYDGLTSPGTWK
jgi:glycine hydroxymethyltransferase